MANWNKYLLKLLLKKCKRRRLNLTIKESRNDENIIFVIFERASVLLLCLP